MELHDWLLHSQFINKDEYKQIIIAQFNGSVSGADAVFDENKYLTYVDPSKNGSNLIRKHPVGDVLAPSGLANTVYERAGVKDLNGLIANWQHWHVEALEPIANYSTTSRFGKNLYENILEKKLVAQFLTTTHVRNTPLINHADTVVISEGSSAFYVGMAIAGYRKNATIATSNAALIREYVDNPAVARSLNDFHVIGGLVDRHHTECRCDHGGVFGPAAEAGFETAICTQPAATVVIMPVSGLLADEGPFATEDFIRQLKFAIADNSLRQKTKVREFVFVADFTKHDPAQAEIYGAPVFERKYWRELIKENSSRVSLVTVPPPATREALAQDLLSHPGMRTMSSLRWPVTPTAKDDAYVRTMKKLAGIFKDDPRLMLHEVIQTERGLTSPSLQLAAMRA